MLTQSYLKEILSYDPETGIFIWLVSNSNRVRIGSEAGAYSQGYCRISVNGKIYSAHRLAFLYMTGEFPVDHVDHIDHDRRNNKWSNLRTVTYKENSKNRSIYKRNKSGFTGVCWHKASAKWRVRIKIDGKDRHLGYFTDKKLAIAARSAANIEFGYHENHGA